MQKTYIAFDAPAAATIIGALDSPLRIQIVTLLAQRDHYVHELVATTEKSQPLISQHLRVLKEAGIVDATRRGRQVSYRLAAPEVLNLLADASTIAHRTTPQVSVS
ncbi:MAG: metalloregulator ArsR/SmtB family transcription factor [Corynebacterium camporealensis]|uniref:ArsR/SmtB family transcription factor n=1 Tax=Corynebacterium camporealensis TaxID=161896 RepID=UPI002A90B526|nr:metalloregulator ArsR/SmtB family transcription factor [Corynebacterium camporealensis]MDY5840960.1 metalloregulator ArsR/SmtB family transcription factor [Corynebacterium camporealensis]